MCLFWMVVGYDLIKSAFKVKDWAQDLTSSPSRTELP